MELAFAANMAYAPVVIFLNERFPTRIRATGTALTWNVGFAMGGLMTAFVSLASPSFGAIPSRLAYFLIGTAVVYLVGALLAPETRGALAREIAAGRPERGGRLMYRKTGTMRLPVGPPSSWGGAVTFMG